MPNFLITGATGNVGQQLVRFLIGSGHSLELKLAVQDIPRARKSFAQFPDLQFCDFDFEDSSTFEKAFQDIETLFLLRPPHISQVEKVFRPLLDAVKKHGIQQVVFLSVQGAESSSVIPHHKIEKLILELGFDYIFVRPGYFMQNLTTALLPEINQNHSITLPAGDAKFNWIDVKDIAEASSQLMLHFDQYKNKAYTITGTENLSFQEVATQMAEVLGKPITYRSINPILFFFKKKKEGLSSGFALVMTLLHFIPRLQPEPIIHPDYKTIAGKEPIQLRHFLQKNRDTFLDKS